jgi:hypothetical protein
MTEVTQILTAIERSQAAAAEEMLPLVYEELRRLAAQKLILENPGQTLQITALVHEACLRLVSHPDLKWNGARHFSRADDPQLRAWREEPMRSKRQTRLGRFLTMIQKRKPCL